MRDFVYSDDIALGNYQTNPLYLEHYETQPNAKEIISAACTWAEETPRQYFQLAICLEPSSELVGSVGIPTKNYPSHEAEFGIEVNPDFWRNGIAFESSNAMEIFAKSLGIVKLHAVTNGSNSRSQQLLEKLGFNLHEKQGSNVLYSKPLIHS